MLTGGGIKRKLCISSGIAVSSRKTVELVKIILFCFVKAYFFQGNGVPSSKKLGGKVVREMGG